MCVMECGDIAERIEEKPALSVFLSRAQGNCEKGLCGGSASATLNNEMQERNDPVARFDHVS